MESYGGGGYFVDEKAVRVENIFLEFLKRYFFLFFLQLKISVSRFRSIHLVICSRVSSFRTEGNAREPFYEAEIEAMRPNESNTMFIDFSHVMRFNDVLQKAISDEFLR